MKVNQRIERGLRKQEWLGAVGGVFLLVLIWLIWRTTGPAPAPPTPVQSTPVAERKPDPPVVYVARREMAVARTKTALDQSPLINPAGFIRVPRGTQVVVTGFGGITGRMHWQLSTIDAGGRRVDLFVYRDSMDGWGKVN